MSENENKSESKVKDYSNDATYNKKSALVTALLKWLECEFFGLFVFLSMLGLSYMLGNTGNIIFGFLGIVCYICVIADFGMKEGSKARVKQQVRGDRTSRHFGLLLGVISMIPALFTYIMLLLSYFGVTGNALMAFKLLNAGLWGLINLFADGSNIANAKGTLLAVYPITLLIYPVTAYVTFRLGFENDDIKTKIMYKEAGDK